MSEEILRKLDELKAGQDELKVGVAELRAGQAGILQRLGALEEKSDASYRLLVEYQKSANDHFETITQLVQAASSIPSLRVAR